MCGYPLGCPPGLHSRQVIMNMFHHDNYGEDNAEAFLKSPGRETEGRGGRQRQTEEGKEVEKVGNGRG